MTKPQSETKSSVAKTSKSTAKPKLEVNPVTDLEPEEEQGDKVRGGPVGNPGRLFSDAILKRKVTRIEGALSRLLKLHL